MKHAECCQGFGALQAGHMCAARPSPAASAVVPQCHGWCKMLQAHTPTKEVAVAPGPSGCCTVMQTMSPWRSTAAPSPPRASHARAQPSAEASTWCGDAGCMDEIEEAAKVEVPSLLLFANTCPPLVACLGSSAMGSSAKATTGGNRAQPRNTRRAAPHTTVSSNVASRAASPCYASFVFRATCCPATRRSSTASSCHPPQRPHLPHARLTMPRLLLLLAALLAFAALSG